MGGVHRVLKPLCVQTAYIIGLIYIDRYGEGRVYRLSSSNYLRICCEIIVILNISFQYRRIVIFSRLSNECIFSYCKIREQMFLSLFQTFLNGDVFLTNLYEWKTFTFRSEALLFFFFFFFLNIIKDMLNLELLKNK